MPSVSKAQQRFMAMCEHDPFHLHGNCPDMTKQQFHDFASTPTMDLPDHIKPPARRHKFRSPAKPYLKEKMK